MGQRSLSVRQVAVEIANSQGGRMVKRLVPALQQLVDRLVDQRAKKPLKR
jgi:hypothetical protein